MSAPPDAIDAEFIPQLLRELAAGGYRPAAWARFWKRTWQRAWTNVRARPRRRSSTLGWISLGLASGVAPLWIAYGDGVRAGLVGAAVTWGVWFSVVSFCVFLLQGFVCSEEGVPYDRFLIANGLSYLRLATAPLLVDPVLSVGPVSPHAPLLLLFLALVIGTDQVDGILARTLRQESRLGRLLDPLADIAFLSWLAAGLHAAGVLPTEVLALVLIRYPGAIVGSIVVFFVRGPVRIKADWVGKVTTWTTSMAFVVIAIYLLLDPNARTLSSLRVLMWAIFGLLAFGIVFLLLRAVRSKAVPID